MTHEELNNKLGRSTRRDTYEIAERMAHGESYDRARAYVVAHWQELGINERIIKEDIIVKLETIKKVLLEAYGLQIEQESQVLKKSKKKILLKVIKKKNMVFMVFLLKIDQFILVKLRLVLQRDFLVTKVKLKILVEKLII